MFEPWPMVQSMTARLLGVVLICATALTFPDYEFELNLYQQNTPWLNCSEGWIKFGTNCFRVYQDKATFSEASTVCRSSGGHLVHIGSLNKNKAIGAAAQSVFAVSEDLWLGFKKKNNKFLWDDGRPGKLHDGIWQIGQPKETTVDLCASMTTSELHGKFRWKLENCDNTLSFVCEIKACVGNEVRWMNGKCVPASLRCDKIHDFEDKSDELNCEEVCGREIITQTNTFQFPEKDGRYPPNVNCQWKIQGPVGKKIRLQFLAFDLEDHYDNLTIRDGPTSNDSIIAVYSGTALPSPITATTNFLLVTFTSDHSIENTGFIARWGPVDAGYNASLVAEDTPKWIISPGYPGTYEGNTQVTWTIKAGGDITGLQVVDVDIGLGDTLKIFDGSEQGADLIALFSGGDKTPEILFTTGEYTLVQLNTDLTGSGKGFNLTYQRGCDITVYFSSGRISSPGYLAGLQYPPNLHCTISRLDAGSQDTTLIFDHFDTELNFDLVKVYKGSITDDEYLLKNASGHLDRWSVKTSSGQFVIKFTSDDSLSGLGWTVSFSYGCHDSSVLPASLQVSSSHALYGSSVTYNCDTGYQVAGVQERYCDMGGLWRSAMPTCKYIYCGPPRELRNGELLNMTSRYFKGVATYKCNPGYELVGDREVTCAQHGWTDFPVCEDIICPKLPPLEHGRTFAPHHNSIHKRVRFQCDLGYRLVGYMFAECHEIGKWSNDLPKCVPENETVCAELKVAHGVVSRYEPVSVGDSVKVKCDGGYQLTAGTANTVTCMPTGEYNNSYIECIDVDECVTVEGACSSGHTCINTAGSFWCKCAAGYHHTENSEYACEDINECREGNGGCEHDCENTAGSYMCICKDGYRQYTDNLTVVDNRILVPGKSCYVLCPALQVENATLFYSSTPIPDGSYLFPTSVFVQCPSNMLLDGPSYITCQEDGNWDAKVTKCLKVQCDEVQDLENGMIEYTFDRHLDTFVKFSCNHGYILNGNQHRYCYLEDEKPQWSGLQPICSAVDCGLPPGVPNAKQLFKTTTYNSSAVYECLPGYRLVGQGIKTCLASGLWSPEITLCVAKTCSTPLMSEYVTMVTDLHVYTNNSQVTFKCNKKGYKITDPYPLMCQVPAQEVYPRSVQLPIHHVPLTVTLQVPSIDHLKGCSLHYSQKVFNWLDQWKVKEKLVESCKYLTTDDITVQEAEIKIESDSKKIAINKTLVVSSRYLAIPVKESCLRSIGDWFRGNGDDFELQSSTECPGIPVSYGSIIVHDTVSLCEDGEMVTLNDVTSCVHNTRVMDAIVYKDAEPVPTVFYNILDIYPNLEPPAVLTNAFSNDKVDTELGCLNDLGDNFQCKIQEGLTDIETGREVVEEFERFSKHASWTILNVGEFRNCDTEGAVVTRICLSSESLPSLTTHLLTLPLTLQLSSLQSPEILSLASSELLLSSGDSLLPSSELLSSSGNSLVPSSELLLSSGDLLMPSSELLLSSGDFLLPSSESSLSSGVSLLPSSEILLSSDGSLLPSSELFLLPEDLLLPLSQLMLSSGESLLPSTQLLFLSGEPLSSTSQLLLSPVGSLFPSLLFSPLFLLLFPPLEVISPSVSSQLSLLLSSLQISLWSVPQFSSFSSSLLLSLQSSPLLPSLSSASVEFMFLRDLSISEKATSEPATEALYKTSKLAVTSTPLSIENGLEISIRPSSVQIDKQYSDVLQPSFFWPSNTITIFPVTRHLQLGPSDGSRMTEVPLTPSLLTDENTKSTESDITASHTPSIPIDSNISAPWTLSILTETYMNVSLTFSSPKADMSASLTYSVTTNNFRDLFSHSTQTDGAYNFKHTFIEGAELKKVYVSTKPTYTDYIGLSYNQSKHIKTRNTTDRWGLTSAGVMFKTQRSPVLTEHKTTGITISKQRELYNLSTTGEQGYTEFVSRFSSSFEDTTRMNHSVQMDSSSFPFHSLHFGPLLSILDTHNVTRETYFIYSTDTDIVPTHIASDALGKHGSIKNTDLSVKDVHSITKDSEADVFSDKVVTVNHKSSVVLAWTESVATVELVKTQRVAEHIKSVQKDVVDVPETKIKQKEIPIDASNTYIEHRVTISYAPHVNITSSETELSTNIEQDMIKLHTLYKESKFRTTDTHPELTVDDVMVGINRSISVLEEFRTKGAASVQQTDPTIGGSSQETQQYYCRCDENTMSLPQSFSQYPGPVTMVIVAIRLSASDSMRLECLFSIREKVKNTTQSIVNDLDLKNLCPEAENVMVSDTSGSMVINNNDIDVRIPFFLYDLSASFTNVQQCSKKVEDKFNKAFISGLKNLAENFRHDCSKLNFEPDNFVYPESFSLCRHGFQYHELAGECVFCGNCAIVSTSIETSTEATTVSIATTTTTEIPSTLSSSTITSTGLSSKTLSSSTAGITSAEITPDKSTTIIGTATSTESTSTTTLEKTTAPIKTTQQVESTEASSTQTVQTKESTKITVEITTDVSSVPTYWNTNITATTQPIESTTESIQPVESTSLERTSASQSPESTVKTSETTEQVTDTTQSTRSMASTEIMTKSTNDSVFVTYSSQSVESTIESTKATLPAENTTERTTATKTTESMTERTKATFTTESTTESTKATLPAENTTKRTTATQTTESMTERTKATFTTESTTESTKATLPAENTTERTTATQTTESVIESTKATQSTEDMTESTEEIQTTETTKITLPTKSTTEDIDTTSLYERKTESTKFTQPSDVTETTTVTLATNKTEETTETTKSTKITEVTPATEIHKTSQVTESTQPTEEVQSSTEARNITYKDTVSSAESTSGFTSTEFLSTVLETTLKTTEQVSTDVTVQATTGITTDPATTKQVLTDKSVLTTISPVTEQTRETTAKQLSTDITVHTTTDTTKVPEKTVQLKETTTEQLSTKVTVQSTTGTTKQLSTEVTVPSVTGITEQVSSGMTIQSTIGTTEQLSTDISVQSTIGTTEQSLTDITVQTTEGLAFGSTTTTAVYVSTVETKIPPTSTETLGPTTTSLVKDTTMPSTTSTTKSIAETSVAFTEPVVTTESPFLVCSPFVVEEEVSQRPSLDYTKEQMRLWWKAEIDCQTTNEKCINGYTSMLSEIIQSREFVINSEKSLRDKCWDKGIYMKLNFSLNALSENKIEFVSVITLTTVTGFDLTLNKMSACASALITYKNLELALCLLYVTEIESGNQNSSDLDCQPFSVMGVRLKSFDVTIGCNDGWEKTVSGGGCIPIPTTTTTEMTSTAQQSASLETTTTAATTTTLATDPLQKLECYTCNGSASNHFCNMTFENCLQEDAVCQTEIDYLGKSVKSISKSCETKENCRLRMQSAVCDPSSNYARCYYCCSESRCNKDVELLDFSKGGKSRKKRSVSARYEISQIGGEKEEMVYKEKLKNKDETVRKKRSVLQHQIAGAWNRTVPKCIDVESPVFVDCPKEPKKVSASLLPVQVAIDIPVAIDNSEIEPMIKIKPDVTQPFFVYEDTLITVTAIDSMKNTATCKIEIHITETACPELIEPPNVRLKCKEKNPATTVCSATCRDSSVFVTPPASEYMCSGDGVWQPSSFIADCVQEKFSHCPIWKYNVTWTLMEDICIGINCDCDFTSAVDEALRNVLENNISNVSVTLTKHSGQISVYAVFSMTGKRQSLQDSCPRLTDLKILDNIKLENACEKSASLINPSLHNNIEDHLCGEGLVRSDDQKAADLCWPCPLGMEARTKVCLPCTVGSYRDNILLTGCQSCPENTSTEHEYASNRSDCKAICSPGYFSPTGLVPCYSCPQNTYQSGDSPTKCRQCPENQCTSGVGTINIDECAESNCKQGICLSSPCQHSGTCIEGQNGYNCKCTDGFTGDRCESPVNLCAEQPCHYGNCVFNHGDRSFDCYCYPGFTGERCSENIDDCLESNCRNGGVCVDKIGSYDCNCTGTGYHGDTCEEKVSYCNHGNCLNGGQCIEEETGFACNCTEGFHGDFCEEKETSCDTTLCSNNGICVLRNKTSTVCVCNASYTGEDCSLNLHCDESACSNHGYCFQTASGKTCQCRPGFTGEICDMEIIQHCHSNPCNYNNTIECVEEDHDFKCICHVGWQGRLCDERIDLCQSEPCKNGGNCSNHGNNYTCHCAPGFAGVTCETNLDECITKPCLNGGMCQDGFNTYTCMCPVGWSGDRCAEEEDACQSSPCEHGPCLDKMDDFVCLCESGWTGLRCSTKVDPCLSMPCLNQGQCTTQHDNVTCLCPEGFTGKNCELEVNPCDSEPCLNGGSCIADGLTFTCACLHGYHGDLCAESEAKCNETVCKNSVNCTEAGLEVICQCLPQFYGPRCQKEKSPDFDIMLKKDKSIVCSTEVVTDELSEITMCVWSSIVHGDAVILNMMDAQSRSLLTVEKNKVTVSLWPVEDGTVYEVRLGITDQSWHQVCVTWSALTNGKWSVYVDAVPVYRENNYGVGNKVSGFKVVTSNGNGTVEGAISGINVYSRVITDFDTFTCNSDQGNIVSWVEFESCAKKLDKVSRPSSCPRSSCAVSAVGDCSDALDKTAPKVLFCPDDIVKVMFSDDLPTGISWSDPVFTDNIGIVDIKQTHQSGQLFTYGEYPVTYTALDSQGNSVSCTFTVYITPKSCLEPAAPLNGFLSCDLMGDAGMECTAGCSDGYMFLEDVASVYTCRYGIWDPPRGKYFSFPTCASFAHPLVKFDGILKLMGPVCSEAAKTNINILLKDQFFQTGLCPQQDCDTVSMNVDCVLNERVKRSVARGQFNVKFSIKNNNITAEESSVLTSQFENSLKSSGIGEYETLNVSMTTELICDVGQVLSQGRCINCGKGYFHNYTAGLCEQCPQGTYNDQEKQTTCRSCDQGKTTLVTGSVSARQCYYICEPGNYLLGEECEPCEAGFYQDQSGSTSCKSCPLGHSTYHAASTSESDCNFMCNILGMEMSVDGSCVPCPVGMYKEARSEVTCQPCPYGYTTASTGAQRLEDCSFVKCGAGERRTANNSCELCPYGTYQSSEGQDCCMRCPFGQTTSIQGAVSSTDCTKLAQNSNACDLGLYDCKHIPGVCQNIDPSYRCQCCSGFTHKDGVCVDNCGGVCMNGDCSKDTEGNPRCLCHSGYQGLQCEQKTEDAMGTGAIAGISVSSVAVVLVVVACVFICFKRQVSKNGERKNFPVHRSDLRSSFRAFALAMKPMRYEGRTSRSASSAIESTQIPRPQWTEIEGSSNSSGQTKDSYF